MAAGFLGDRFFARGRTDIHMYLIIGMAIFKGLFIFAGVAAGDLWIAAVTFGLATFFSGIVGVAPAALQMVTPNEYRGQVSASFLFIMNLVGLGTGPLITGAIATCIFHDRAMIGWALVLTFVLLQPFAVLFVWLAARGMRRLVISAEAWVHL